MRKLQILAVCILGLSLTSCAAIREQQKSEAVAKFRVDAEECLKGKMTRKTAVYKQTCIDDALVNRFEEIHYSHTDLIRDNAAANKRAAMAYADGSISQKVFISTIYQNSAALSQARQQAEAIDQAKVQQFFEGLSDAYNQQRMISAMNRSTIQPSPIIHTTCQRYAWGVDCSSN